MYLALNIRLPELRAQEQEQEPGQKAWGSMGHCKDHVDGDRKISISGEMRAAHQPFLLDIYLFFFSLLVLSSFFLLVFSFNFILYFSLTVKFPTYMIIKVT